MQFCMITSSTLYVPFKCHWHILTLIHLRHTSWLIDWTGKTYWTQWYGHKLLINGTLCIFLPHCSVFPLSAPCWCFTYLIKNNPQNCNYCKSLLTVEYILTSCSAYKNIIEKHYSNFQLSHILTNISKQHIFNYLSEINFFLKNFLYGTMWLICAESAFKPQPT